MKTKLPHIEGIHNIERWLDAFPELNSEQFCIQEMIEGLTFKINFKNFNHSFTIKKSLNEIEEIFSQVEYKKIIIALQTFANFNGAFEIYGIYPCNKSLKMIYFFALVFEIEEDPVSPFLFDVLSNCIQINGKIMLKDYCIPKLEIVIGIDSALDYQGNFVSYTNIITNDERSILIKPYIKNYKIKDHILCLRKKYV